MSNGVTDERKQLALTQGWGWPANSKKAHYFRAGEIQSECRKWAYAGEREDTHHDSPDNCAACMKRRASKGGAR